MTQLTEHFSLKEMTASRRFPHIPNTPTLDAYARVLNTAVQMEAVRKLLDDNPITITSGYRSPELNEAADGSRNSDHMRGDAADFLCPGFGSPLRIAEKIAASDIRFDQLILEYGWVHISFGPRMRGQLLTKRSKDHPYEHGLNA